jgi:prepilin-type processing-associated H-X9-DG protein
MIDNTVAGGVLVCPGDLDGAIRSYSMNLFASSYVSTPVVAAIEGPNPPGKLFKAGAKESSHLILVIESFSSWEAPGHEPQEVTGPMVGYVSNAIIGFWANPPAERFGAGGGVPFPGGRFGDELKCQVAYFRHRNQKTNRLITDAYGRVNIGFLDGHVATLRHDELADFEKVKSTFTAMWSPIDRELVKRLLTTKARRARSSSLFDCSPRFATISPHGNTNRQFSHWFPSRGRRVAEGFIETRYVVETDRL